MSQTASVPPPTTRLEDWRYVTVKALGPVLQGGQATPQAPTELAGLPAIVLNADSVQVQGALPDGASFQEQDASAEAFAGDPEQDPQISWSNEGPARSLQLRGVVGPLLLLHGGGQQRLRIHVAAGAAADLILVHRLAAEDNACLALDVELADGSALRLDEVEQLDAEAQLLSHRRLRVAGGASVAWTAAGLGARLVRHRWDAELLAAGAEVRLAACAVLRGSRQQHHLVRVHHRAGETTSDQLFRCVADDAGRSSFDGLVRIDEHCENAHAEQSANNLQLSPRARVYARPQLDVNTDDVVASHGSSTGQPDPHEQFYLRSRGIPKQLAERLVMRGFIDEVVHRMTSPLLKAAAEEHTDLTAWLG
ncbi:MAG: SufD family Fe-S cluster assembly protein [Planctomycetota bacterium]